MERDYRYLSLKYSRLLEQRELRSKDGAARGQPGLQAQAPAGLQGQVPSHASAGAPRKRKPSSFGSSASVYDGSSEDSRSVRTLPEYKRGPAAAARHRQTHSEVEKRRRDKMNRYIAELSAMVPPAACGASAGAGAGGGGGGGARRLDKTTVLKMAVKYLRGIRGSEAGDPWPARPPARYLSEAELNHLVLQAARGAFLIAVECDGGRSLYVSASVKDVLRYEQAELVGQSVFDLLHPSDVATFKGQLSPWEGGHDRCLDPDVPAAAAEGGASRFCSGARRSFFCRIKCEGPPVKQEPGSSDLPAQRHNKYCLVHFTGYLKSWSPAEVSDMGEGGEGGGEGGCGLSCLVAVGRALADLAPQPPGAAEQPPPPPPPPARPVQYTSRHAADGKFLFVDPRVTAAVGYLPHELVGSRLEEHVAAADAAAVAGARRALLPSRPYAFRAKGGSTVRLQTHFKPFRNPWTKEEEHLVANNTVVGEPRASPGAGGGAGAGPPSPGAGVLKQETAPRPSSRPPPLALEPAPGELPPAPAPAFDVPLASPAEASWDPLVEGAASPLAEPLASLGLGPEGVWEGVPSANLDGNDEAAMSIIMSLLEADAGLGGPVNLSGLPWPLP